MDLISSYFTHKVWILDQVAMSVSTCKYMHSKRQAWPERKEWYTNAPWKLNTDPAGSRLVGEH